MTEDAWSKKANFVFRIEYGHLVAILIEGKSASFQVLHGLVACVFIDKDPIIDRRLQEGVGSRGLNLRLSNVLELLGGVCREDLIDKFRRHTLVAARLRAEQRARLSPIVIQTTLKVSD